MILAMLGGCGVLGGGGSAIQIGATGTDPGIAYAGRVRVLSGASLSAGSDAALFDLHGAAGDFLSDVSVLGDVDGDALPDLVFAQGEASQTRFASGAAMLAGISSVQALPTVGGPGALPAPVGDVTGDGVRDVLLDDGNGWVDVYSGADLFGAPVAVFHDPIVAIERPRPAGDVNGDGIGDLVADRIGAGEPSGPKSERSPSLDTVIFWGPLEGDPAPDIYAPDVVLPVATSGVGDVNADGHADLAVFRAFGDPNDPDVDLAVFDGASVADVVAPDDATWVLSGGHGYPRIHPAADLDGDGRDDLWVDMALYEDPRLEVFSGADLDGRALGSPDLRLGFRVVRAPAVGDFDGDGQRDVVVAYGTDPEVRLYLAPSLDGGEPGRPDVVLGTEESAYVATIGDLDGDGADDLVLVEPKAR